MRRALLVGILTVAALAQPDSPAPAAAPAATTARSGPAPASADDAGLVSTWVWHFDGEMRLACLPTYRELLEELPSSARIIVGATTAEDLRTFREEMGLGEAPDPRVTYVETGEWVSGWARDRYVLFAKDGKECLFLPRRDAVGPRRLGDIAVAHALQHIEPDLQMIDSDLSLEGGNLLFTPDELIVGPAAVTDNVVHGDGGDEVARARIEQVFGRRLVVTADPESPLAREHADMYVAVAGPKKLFLGDPRAALAALERGDNVRRFGSFPREKQIAMAEEYDRIAAHLTEEGFEVRRLPILHAEDHVILTWTNAVVETRDGKRRVYLPYYGLKHLDRIAQEAWEAVGCEVVPINAEALIVLGGAVRCVTNTRRDAVPPAREEGEDPCAGESEPDKDADGAGVAEPADGR